MGELFWNKVFGVILALFLFIMALGILTEVVFSEGGHDDGEAHYGYPVDLSALESSGGGEAEEEGPVDYGALLMAADVSAGERVFRRCSSCHTAEQGGANGTGPALWDVMGRAVASVDGFNYSGAFQEYAEGGTVWGYENMSNFLENPRQYIPGTAMSFAGLRNQEDRINIIAYLRSLSNDPLPLPEPLPEEEETGGMSDETEAASDDVMNETDGEVAETEAEGADTNEDGDDVAETADESESDDAEASEDTDGEAGDEGEEPGR